MDQYLLPIHTIFRGMNIHKSQLFWCELQGYYCFWHTAILGRKPVFMDGNSANLQIMPSIKKHGANPHDFWPHLRETVLDTRKPITPNGHSFQVPLGHMMYTPFKLSSSELLKGNLVIKLYFDSSNAGFWIFRDSRITCSKAWFVTSGGYIFPWVACIAKHK